MPVAKPSSAGTFQINPDDFLSAYPQFYNASSAINGAADTLKNALGNDLPAFDGKTHQNLQTLGDSCVSNLQSLAGALDILAQRLQQSAQAAQSTDDSIKNTFA